MRNTEVQQYIFVYTSNKNGVFDYLYLLYDPTHLIKNIRNNWVTEKTQKLVFKVDKWQLTVTAKWADLVSVYHDEKENDVRMTPIDLCLIDTPQISKNKKFHLYKIFI